MIKAEQQATLAILGVHHLPQDAIPARPPVRKGLDLMNKLRQAIDPEARFALGATEVQR